MFLVIGGIYLDHIVHIYVGQCSIDFGQSCGVFVGKLSFLELVLCCSIFGFFCCMEFLEVPTKATLASPNASSREIGVFFL